MLDFIYQNIRCAFLDPIMAGLSYFASSGIGWLLLAVILIIPRKTRVWGCLALCAVALGFVLGDMVIKNLICRPRPYDDYLSFHTQAMPFVLNAGTENSYSFPSGHSCCSFASATVYFAANKRLGAAALIFAGLIAFSRLYNYVHFFTDVVAGSLLGVFCAVAVVLIYNKILKTKQQVKH